MELFREPKKKKKKKKKTTKKKKSQLWVRVIPIVIGWNGCQSPRKKSGGIENADQSISFFLSFFLSFLNEYSYFVTVHFVLSFL